MFEVRLVNGGQNLRPLVECVEGNDANDAKEKLEKSHVGDWKIDKITLIGRRLGK